MKRDVYKLTYLTLCYDKDRQDEGPPIGNSLGYFIRALLILSSEFQTSNASRTLSFPLEDLYLAEK